MSEVVFTVRLLCSKLERLYREEAEAAAPKPKPATPAKEVKSTESLEDAVANGETRPEETEEPSEDFQV